MSVVITELAADKPDAVMLALVLRAVAAQHEPIALPDPVEARKIRERAGLSRNQVALTLNVQAHQLVRWERGWQRPSAEHSEAYGRLLAYLRSLAS